MPGFSITLLRLPAAGENAPHSAAEILELVDAPADAPGWAWHSKTEPGEWEAASSEAKTNGSESADHAIAHTVENVGKPLAPASANQFIGAIEQACKDVIAAEPELTRFDTIAGDGDCGLCLEAGGKGILRAIADGRVSDKDVISAVLTMAEQIEIDMDGTSGALYSIAFNGLASGLRKVAEDKGTDVATADVWAGALVLAKETLYTYTRGAFLSPHGDLCRHLLTCSCFLLPYR
jgi:dihydroxyacetone kinase